MAPGQLSSPAFAWETDGGFIPQPHHTYRLLMIHLFFTIQSLCSTREGHSTGYEAGKRRQGLPPPLLTEAFPAGDSQAAFQAQEQPPDFFHLLHREGKLIPTVCPRPDILLVNHSPSQGKKVSRRHLYNEGLPLICPSHSPVGACVTYDWDCRGFAERVERWP